MPPYTVTVLNSIIISTGSFIKEELRLQYIWTDRGTDRVKGVGGIIIGCLLLSSCCFQLHYTAQLHDGTIS